MDAQTAAAVRSGAKDARNLEDAGRHPQALRCADRLVNKHPTSAMAYNLIGVLRRRGAVRAGGGDFSDIQFEEARSAYSEAARLAPNCIVTAVSHAEALMDCQKYYKAMSELKRADKIPKPDDPAAHYAGFEIKSFGYHKKNNREMRLENARKLLSVELDKLREKVETQVIRKEMEKVLLLSCNEMVRALNRAKVLAKEWPFSGRAQLLLVLIQLQHDFVTSPGISKADILRRSMSAMEQIERNFPSSLVVALLMATLMDELDDPTAIYKCRRALALKTPNDPMIHAIPYDHFTGTDSEERIASAKLKIKALHDRIITEAKRFWGSFAVKDSVTNMRVNDLAQYTANCWKQDPKTIHAAFSFFKEHHQWDFVYGGITMQKCYPDSNSLRLYYGKWKVYHLLNNALGDKVYEIKPMDVSSNLDVISYDPLQPDSFILPHVDDLLDLMLSQTDAAVVPEFNIIEKKVEDLSPIIQDLKQELSALTEDTNSTQYQESCTKIQDLWLKLLHVLYFDYREIILPVAQKFQWAQLKKHMADVNMQCVLKHPESLFIMEPFCFKCWEKGHRISDCKLCLLCSSDSHSTSDCPLTRKPMPLSRRVGCAERGQQFYAASQLSCQPAIALIVVEVGSVSVEELVQEFSDMFVCGWKWTAMEQGQQEFHMKFPNVASIELLPESPFTLPKSGALIRVSKKVSTVRPKGKLPLVWVLVDGIPDDERRDPECLREIGSMIGLVKQIDIQMLQEYDKVRMKVYIKEPNMLPHREMYVVDGDIYYIDFILDSVIAPGFSDGNCSNKNEGNVYSKDPWSYVLDGSSQVQLESARSCKELSGKGVSTELGDMSPSDTGKPIAGVAAEIVMKRQKDEALGETKVTSEWKYYEKDATKPTVQSAQKQQEVRPSVPYMPSSVTNEAELPDKVVLGEVVPEGDVNLFAHYCKAAECWQDTYTICHICSIDGVADLQIKILKMDEHIKKVHKLDGELYECDECHTRARTCADIRRHYHFAHFLPKGWWKSHID